MLNRQPHLLPTFVYQCKFAKSWHYVNKMNSKKKNENHWSLLYVMRKKQNDEKDSPSLTDTFSRRNIPCNTWTTSLIHILASMHYQYRNDDRYCWHREAQRNTRHESSRRSYVSLSRFLRKYFTSFSSTPRKMKESPTKDVCDKNKNRRKKLIAREQSILISR